VVRSSREENLSSQSHCYVDSSQEEMAFWMMTDGGENLDELFGSSMPRLFRAADCILHNYHDSEDALQDGLLSALRHIDQFKGNSQFSTWLFSIIRNCALAKLRKQHAHPYISIDEHNVEGDAEFCSLEMPADPRPDPERACAQAELSFQFAQTLEGLPASYRAIIRLCDSATSSRPQGHPGINGHACGKKELLKLKSPVRGLQKWFAGRSGNHGEKIAQMDFLPVPRAINQIN
jgi:RNA polymerase sigma-70 factor (ECF subfamily)